VNPAATTLEELSAEYTWAVNAAVAEDRDDLVQRLALEYEEASLRLLTAEVLGAAS
jgi:hypothetical protein